MKGVLSYAASTIAIVGVLGWLLTLVFRGPGDVRAIWLSAAVAGVVQVVSFTVLRLYQGRSMLAGRGAGVLMRMLTLIIYTVLVAKVLALPATAALLSMVAFFFVTTLIEPLFLHI